MVRSLIYSSKERTDAKSILSVSNVTHTSCDVQWKNESSTTATFRVTHVTHGEASLSDGSLPTMSDFRVGGNTIRTVSLAGLGVDKAYDIRLYRLENDKILIQDTTEKGKYVLTVRTHPLLTNASTSSAAAIVKWRQRYPGSYRVLVSDTTPVPPDKPFQVIETTEPSGSGWYSASISSLTKNKRYYALIQASEATNLSGTKSYVDIGETTFVTSNTVDLMIDSYSATYADLSWDGTGAGDDEEDSTAEFSLTRWVEGSDGESWSSQTVIMDWAADTTKSFRATGLSPGTGYYFRLKRKGVDGISRTQSNRTIVTLTTTFGLADPTTTTRAKVEWSSIYEGAMYQVRYTPSGQTPIVIGGSSGLSITEALLKNLAPDTLYEIDLLVVENNSSHLIKSVTTRTQKNPEFSAASAGHTSILMNLDSQSDEPTQYYFRTDIAGSSGTFTVPNAQAVTRDIRELLPGTTYRITLYRYEYEQYVLQFGSVTYTTKSAPDVSTSISSTTAMLTWDTGYAGALYQIEVFRGALGGGGPSVGLYEDYTHVVLLSGLSMETVYHAVLSVKEPDKQDRLLVTELGDTQFETSAGATLHAVKILASSVELSWSLGEVKEDDGVAEFKIQKRKNPGGSYTDATQWIPHTVAGAKITGLEPGTSYNFALVRLGLDGKNSVQIIVEVTTKGSTLRVDSRTSTTVEVGWDSVYEGAQYKLVYTAEGGSPVAVDGSTGRMTATLTGMTPDTTYNIELFVIEDGGMVGTNTLTLSSLGTNSPVAVSNPTRSVVISGVFMGTIILVIMWLVMRRND